MLMSHRVPLRSIWQPCGSFTARRSTSVHAALSRWVELESDFGTEPALLEA
jgi:hypothetical protein